MRRSLIPAAALVAAMAGSLALAPAASAADGPTVLPLHQAKDLPLTASEWTGSKEKVCGDIPTGQDGWHFVLPGSGKGESAVFTKLTVEFKPGGVQTITVFGPPSDKHAYVGSAPGAELISASAEVKGTAKKEWFNLSHTCPASTTPTPTDTPSGTPSETPSETPSGTPSETPSGTPSETASTGTPSESPSSSESPSTGATPSASTGSSGGDLAETGSSAPVGIIAAVAVALAGAGSVLVMRRRKAQQH
ncbi:LPXTG cell wall anchor domain-containing protein [Streptomyces sp. NPDC048350]|uniref:LPXTG cell wall anchor domain-containing protein n=1 Tax=Streptomyces sp. NPDC048350 TaxID=3365538 RepID=UPI003715ECED